MKTAEEILRALAEPFEKEEIKYKPAVVSGNRAMALFYVDARVVQDRLDDVLGVENWQDDYETKEEGSVVCRLRIRIGGEWITKVDVGSPSEQPDGGDRLKAAFSDALKRAAVKFGIGRFLYRLPQQWCDYDANKRQFVRPPQLPASLYAPKQEQPRPAEKPAPKQPEPKAPEAKEPALPPLRDKVLPLLQREAGKGVESLKAAWTALTKWEQQACAEHKETLKAAAASADAEEARKKEVPETPAALAARVKQYEREFKAVVEHNGFQIALDKCAKLAHFPEDPLTWTTSQVRVAAGWLDEYREDVLKRVEEQKAAVA